MTQTGEFALSARERLRSETRVQHIALDTLLGQLRPFETVERYAVYLAGMRDLYTAYGYALDRCAELAQLPPRKHEMIDAVDSDLQSCQAAPRETATSTTPLSDSEVWGAAYVLEGSAMGAQMLVRKARETLPAEVGVRFLTALAGEGVSRFRAFCAAMEAANVTPDEAVSAADRVFQRAIDWYVQRLAELNLGAGPTGGIQLAT